MSGSSSRKNRAAEAVRSGDRIVINKKKSIMPKNTTIKRGRDAKTGRFVTTEYANKHKGTTVVETIKIKK
jgi:hypothetical protein